MNCLLQMDVPTTFAKKTIFCYWNEMLKSHWKSVNLILSILCSFNVLGTSSVARGLSVYLDALTNNTMSNFFLENVPMNVDFLAQYPDFFSFFVVLLLTVLLSIGVKESSILNNVFTMVNLATIITVIVSGAIKGKLKTRFSLFLK